jgi:hypothetical protein
MSSQGDGQPVLYQVRISEHDRNILKERHREAALAGRGEEFLAALRQIIQRLRKDPLTFGEPIYRLPAIQLLVRQAVVLPLVVDYGVHEERPLVFIRGFKVLS